MKKLPKYLKTVIILLALIIITGLPAISPRLCDWYTDHIYGVLCDAVSHITGVFPFALGEIIMYLGIVLLVAGIVFLLLLIFLRKKPRYRKFVKVYFQSFSIALLIVVLIYMPAWFVPFCGTVLGQGNPELRTTFTYEEISDLLRYVVESGNAAAEEIAIAEDGNVAFSQQRGKQGFGHKGYAGSRIGVSETEGVLSSGKTGYLFRYPGSYGNRRL